MFSKPLEWLVPVWGQYHSWAWLSVVFFIFLKIPSLDCANPSCMS